MELETYAKSEGHLLMTPADLEASLLSYFDDLYLGGHHVTLGQRTLYGLRA